MEKYTLNFKGRKIEIRGEIERSHEIYHSAPIDQMAEYYAGIAAGDDSEKLDTLSNEELARAIEEGFKKETIEASGEKLWMALFAGNTAEVERLVNLPKNAR